MVIIITYITLTRTDVITIRGFHSYRILTNCILAFCFFMLRINLEPKIMKYTYNFYKVLAEYVLLYPHNTTDKNIQSWTAAPVSVYKVCVCVSIPHLGHNLCPVQKVNHSVDWNDSWCTRGQCVLFVWQWQ